MEMPADQGANAGCSTSVGDPSSESCSEGFFPNSWPVETTSRRAEPARQLSRRKRKIFASHQSSLPNERGQRIYPPREPREPSAGFYLLVGLHCFSSTSILHHGPARCATTAAARLVAMDASDPLCAAALNARYSIRAGGATAAELRPPATFPSTTPPTRRQAHADCHREEGEGARRIRSPRARRGRARARAGAREPRQRRRHNASGGSAGGARRAPRRSPARS